MLLVQQGDRQAFEVLFERWRDPIWSFLVRRAGDPEVASDLYQEVFLRVWRSAGTWHATERLRPWIYRIAANVGRDRFRRSTREITTVEIDPERGGQFTDPLAAVDVERALTQIPETLREAFLLGALSGLDHNEVAAALGISPANARARISRARIALRAILLGAPDGEAQ